MIISRKAHELDIVELTEDLAEYGLKRGDRGTVVEVFAEPAEAYMLEFVGESGTESVIADWVKPEQVINLSAAKAAFEKGWALFQEGDENEAERYFREAVKIRPDEIKVLNNNLVRNLERERGGNRWKIGIRVFSLALRVDPACEITRRNLAVAYFRRGIQQGEAGNPEQAINLFSQALLVSNDPELSHRVRKNIGVALASMAEKLLSENKPSEAAQMFEQAQLAGYLTPLVLNDYAVALAGLGRPGDAVSALERAAAQFPSDETIRENLEKAGNAAGDLRRLSNGKAGMLMAQSEDARIDFQIEAEQEYQIAA